MSYRNTFIRVAPDCPVAAAVAPTPKAGKPTVPFVQYDILSRHPYAFDHEDLLVETYVRHKLAGVADERRRAEIRAELLAKSQPCLRASMLPKAYGWGVHYDADGRIAIYGVESKEYRDFVENGETTLLYAMRNKR